MTGLFYMGSTGKNCIFCGRIFNQNTNSVIQRIQTVYLVVAFILNIAVFFTPIYSHALDDPMAWVGMGFAIILTIAALSSLVSVFLYKNRNNQLRWVKLTVYLQIAAMGWATGILFSLGGIGTFLLEELLSVALLALALLAQILAARNIKKDQELVRSMDRIR